MVASDVAFLLSPDSNRVLTLDQLHSWTERIASGLRGIGVGPGDVVVAETASRGVADFGSGAVIAL